MKKIQQIEKEIINNKNLITIDILKIVLKVMDLYNNTNEAQIFDDLYLTIKTIKNIGYIVNKYHIDERTLFNYRTKFCKYYTFIIENIK